MKSAKNAYNNLKILCETSFEDYPLASIRSWVVTLLKDYDDLVKSSAEMDKPDRSCIDIYNAETSSPTPKDYEKDYKEELLPKKTKHKLSVAEKVVKVLKEELGIEVEHEGHLELDYGADSLDQVECVMVLEEEFNIEIPDYMLEKLIRVEDIIAYIEAELRS